MVSTGSAGDACVNPENPGLVDLWNNLYQQISDKYQATGSNGIPIIDKNYQTHLGKGKPDCSKSVVT